MCWKPAPPSHKNYSKKHSLFLSLNTSPRCLPLIPSLLLDFSRCLDEKLPLSFRFISASHSPCLRQCLNVNEFASLTSFILLPLTHRTALLIISKPGVEPGGSNPLSTARRFAKSIAANEGLDKRKPQYKLNKLR